MPDTNSSESYLKAIADLASQVVFEWDYYDDPARMITPISEAYYSDLHKAIEQLRTVLDEMSLEHPELTPRYSRFNITIDPHRGWSDEPGSDVLTRLARFFHGIEQ